jgi:TATA-box binding protein (TBP) (component of TFIID and TFIIIB)
MKMETVICNICKNPTFLCKCDNTWDKFDTLLTEKCKGKTENDVVYTDINISTMTICFNFNQHIDLKKLKEELPESLCVKYKPESKKSKVPKKKGTDSFYNSFDIKITIVDHSKMVFSNISIFIFPNGKVKAAGVKTISTINLMIDELIQIINYVPGTVENPQSLAGENIKIQMICSDFKIKPVKEDIDGWCIKQEELKNALVKENYSATFSALSRYPGINLKVPSIVEEGKNISLLIFRSGCIIITGAKNALDVCNGYKFIIDIICKNKERLFYYDINEEIKQKRKNKK